MSAASTPRTAERVTATRAWLLPAALRRGVRGLAGGLVAVLAVAGCATPTNPDPEPAAPPPATATADLAAMKRASGIDDCPTSDPEVAARPDGLPDLVIECLGGGRPVRLAGLRGRPLIINVWAQWCAPCREEAPVLAEVSAKNRSDALFLGVDYADPRPDYAIEFAQLSGWTFPQLVDAETALKVPLQLGAGAPQTLFVTAEGAIAHRKAGPFRSAAELRALADDHLGVDL